MKKMILMSLLITSAGIQAEENNASNWQHWLTDLFGWTTHEVKEQEQTCEQNKDEKACESDATRQQQTIQMITHIVK